jgi:hypothetical protein
MRKFSLFLLLLLLACRTFSPVPLESPATSTPVRPAVVFDVHTHPDGPLYVGDKVSFEVIPPPETETSGTAVRLNLGQTRLGEEDLQPFGIQGRREATFYWVWDTQGLEAGDYTLTFSLLPGGGQWDEKVTLLPAAGLPLPEPEARWESTETVCCVIHYISGTQAESDLESLKASADAQAADVEARFGVKLNGKIPVTFLPRVLGHGGFTSDGIYVSYLSQNYAGNNTSQVLHHEMVHWLDNQPKSDLRPSVLQEGLAVYLSDGHFKVEPILPRAAALLDLGWYVPLRQLADTFYFSQHEVGYAEAAALISYLMTTYGKDEFYTFYRNIPSAPGGSQAAALDAALQAHFQLSLDELDQNFMAFLRQQSFSETDRTDLRLTVAFYDTVRRYQQALDPSAYFLHAWLPNPSEMRQRGIVADFLRHPQSSLNQQIETRLVSADASLRAGRYSEVEDELKLVNLSLDLYHYWVK